MGSNSGLIARARIWWSDRAPGVALSVALIVCLAAVIPGSLDARLFAAGAVSVIVVLFSFIRIPKTPKPTSKSLIRETDRRAVDTLPSLASLDTSRPLLAVRDGADGEKVLYLIILRDEVRFGTDGTEQEWITMWQRVKRGRVPSPDYYYGLRQLRGDLVNRKIKVVPQSEFTDGVGIELFGEDWREE